MWKYILILLWCQIFLYNILQLGYREGFDYWWCFTYAVIFSPIFMTGLIYQDFIKKSSKDA